MEVVRGICVTATIVILPWGAQPPWTGPSSARDALLPGWTWAADAASGDVEGGEAQWLASCSWIEGEAQRGREGRGKSLSPRSKASDR